MTHPIFEFISGKIKKEYPFTMLDVGAMDGVAKKWSSLSGFMKAIAFEPDEREFAILKNDSDTIYFNYALYNKSQQLNFYVTKGHGKSSIYKPNIDFLSQFEDLERFHIEEVKTLPPEKVKTLDSVIEENSIGDIDFVKLDTQGSELHVLEGCLSHVIPKAFGMQIEVEFAEIYKGQPLFRDVDGFMHGNGLQLLDLRRFYWKRKDYHDYAGKGQLIFGDALYFKRLDILLRDLSGLQDKAYGASKIYKVILICLVHRMFDYAVSAAGVGFKLGYLSKSEYGGLLSGIKAYSNKGAILKFPGKRRLYNMLNLVSRRLRPESYLGWADGDDEIGNIKYE